MPAQILTFSKVEKKFNFFILEVRIICEDSFLWESFLGLRIVLINFCYFAKSFLKILMTLTGNSLEKFKDVATKNLLNSMNEMPFN